MKALEARSLLKATLAPLGVPVKFRGEVLPTDAVHILVDIVFDQPIVTLTASADDSITLFQLGFWSRPPFSNASTSYDAAHPLLIAAGFLNVGPVNFTTQDNWNGIIADYEYT